MSDDLKKLVAAASAAYEAMSPVEKALHDSDQKRSYVFGETGRDPGDVLADEVRRLQKLLAVPTTKDGRRLGHSALRVKDGKLERFDPNPNVTYVPGLLRCAKCKFELITSTLHVYSGTISANSKASECANGCGPMWRVSEADYRRELLEQVNKLFDENEALRRMQK